MLQCDMTRVECLRFLKKMEEPLSPPSLVHASDVTALACVRRWLHCYQKSYSSNPYLHGHGPTNATNLALQ